MKKCILLAFSFLYGHTVCGMDDAIKRGDFYSMQRIINQNEWQRYPEKDLKRWLVSVLSQIVKNTEDYQGSLDQDEDKEAFLKASADNSNLLQILELLFDMGADPNWDLLLDMRKVKPLNFAEVGDSLFECLRKEGASEIIVKTKEEAGYYQTL